MEARPNSQTNGRSIQVAAGTRLTADEPETDWSSNGPQLFIWSTAALFFAATTSLSWSRWAHFQYRTFDLAYYVQAIWQLIHGRFAVTVENVPLLGNHVEPIVFLFAPIFALVRHPMVFVVIQNAALATMGPIGYILARRLGFEARTAVGLAVALLLAPATGYIALHEFHPEALAAPLLLLMFYGRAAGRLWLHFLGFLGVLACKENMALLLSAYCVVFLVIERRRPAGELVRWYGGPLALAILWFILCTKLIGPVFNSGNIDYLALYDRLGKNAVEIAWNALTKPQMVFGALVHALRHGNLVWALLFPFLGLSLLRPRWLVVAAPILLQHLLSWRSSEWTIYFHYAAPLLPVMWIGGVEALVMLRNRWRTVTSPDITAKAAWLMVLGCLTAQLWIGPAQGIWSELRSYGKRSADRTRKESFIQTIPTDASVVAPLPYLSHLAMREKLYSLHYILKGLKTLSRESYQPPPPPDVVFIDYNDTATFDAGAGYYHPQMRTADGRIIPSSDRLLHDFLAGAVWEVASKDELTLFRKISPNEQRLHDATDVGNGGLAADESGALARTGNELRSIRRAELRTGANQDDAKIALDLDWNVNRYREIFPWMILRLEAPGHAGARSFTKGFCAIEPGEGAVEEHWESALPGLEPGEYNVEAVFVHNAKRAWLESQGSRDLLPALLGPPIALGKITVPPPAK